MYARCLPQCIIANFACHRSELCSRKRECSQLQSSLYLSVPLSAVLRAFPSLSYLPRALPRSIRRPRGTCYRVPAIVGILSGRYVSRWHRRQVYNLLLNRRGELRTLSRTSRNRKNARGTSSPFFSGLLRPAAPYSEYPVSAKDKSSKKRIRTGSAARSSS